MMTPFFPTFSHYVKPGDNGFMLRREDTHVFRAATLNTIAEAFIVSKPSSLMFTDNATLDAFRTAVLKSRSGKLLPMQNCLRVLDLVENQTSVCTIEAFLRVELESSTKPAPWSDLSVVDWAAAIEDPRYANSGFPRAFNAETTSKPSNAFLKKHPMLTSPWDQSSDQAYQVARHLKANLAQKRVLAGDFANLEPFEATVIVAGDRLIIEDVPIEDWRDHIYLVSPYTGIVCKSYRAGEFWKITPSEWGKTYSRTKLAIGISRAQEDSVSYRITKSTRTPTAPKAWIDVLVAQA